MDPDDVAYRKSVRNTVKVLAVVVAVIAAALILTGYFDVTPNSFQTSTSVPSAYPFTLSLAINTTSTSPDGVVAISAWLNATSTGNVTSVSLWGFNQSRLVSPPCSSGFPVAIGVMQGHYTLDNYSVGTLLPISHPLVLCPIHHGSPPWFYFGSQSSRVLVTLDGTPEFWVLSTSYGFGADSIGKLHLPPGVYTAVAVDEWGDFVLTNFRVS